MGHQTLMTFDVDIPKERWTDSSLSMQSWAVPPIFLLTPSHIFRLPSYIFVGPNFFRTCFIFVVHLPPTHLYCWFPFEMELPSHAFPSFSKTRFYKLFDQRGQVQVRFFAHIWLGKADLLPIIIIMEPHYVFLSSSHFLLLVSIWNWIALSCFPKF